MWAILIHTYMFIYSAQLSMLQSVKGGMKLQVNHDTINILQH